MAMSSFRRSTATENKFKGGGGRKGSFYDRLHIPKEAEGYGASLVVVRGEYKDYNPPPELVEIDPRTGQQKDVINFFFKLKKHKRKLMMNGREQYRDEPCSAGNDPHNPQPCAGCMAMDRGDKSVGLSDAYFFTVLHMAVYHSHPLLDKNSRQIVMKKDNSGPVMILTECEGRLCNFCRVAAGQAPVQQQGTDPWPGWQANQFTTQFGNRRYLEVGKSHLDNLGAFESIIGSKCWHPQCGSQLVTDSYTCPNCTNVIIDMASDTRSDEEIAKAVLNPYPCLTCRQSVLLHENVSCEVCETAHPPRQFVQRSLFDSVVTLFKSGEGTKSQIQMRNSVPFDAMTAQLQGQGLLPPGRTVDQLIQEIAKPYDFAEMFKARPLEDQMKKLGLETQTQTPQGSAYGAYGQPPQQPQYQAQFMPPQGGVPSQAPFMPQQPQMTGYVPQQSLPQNTAGVPQFGGYQPPGTGTAVNQVQPGPAPFVPNPRTNFGS